MKIIRHTARDMRQAMRAVREQLGDDAVILSSRRTGEGVEITAAIDFDASTLEAGGFANSPVEPPPIIEAQIVSVPAVAASSAVASRAVVASAPRAGAVASAPRAAAVASTPRAAAAAGHASAPAHAAGHASAPAHAAGRAAAVSAPRSAATATAAAASQIAAQPTRGTASNISPVGATAPSTRASIANNPTVLALTMRAGKANKAPAAAPVTEPSQQTQVGYHGGLSYSAAAGDPEPTAPDLYAEQAPYASLAQDEPAPTYNSVEEEDAWISEAAREAVAEHVAAPRAPVLSAAPTARQPTYEVAVQQDYDDEADHDPIEEIREATLTPLASNEIKAAFAEFQAPAAPAPAAAEAMGNELKTLRRMLENQLAHLAWNDLTRRAPVHTEILRELTEIGITQDLAEHLVRQLPEDAEVTFARRFTIAGLSQYLKVTGDRWLDDGGRVAFAGATGVGKTTTLAKIAVRWVLRHGPRDIALVAGDSVRIGAQDQLRSLAQLLGVPVYTPERFDSLPALLSRLNERLILIDTPGSSVRDPQLAGRLAVLANSASKLETALVLAASTQAGAIEEAVKHYAPANPSCCVLTKLDEAASLGGALSVLIRARLPVSYMSEGQRVPEDLRPARALELVSAAVRLAKARGAAADEDLLRRRFGKTAHGIS
jgi:flagellar biosynthesis protein FlhF